MWAMAAAQDVIAQIQADQPRFRLVRVGQAGRLFLPSSSYELSCSVLEMSPGEARVQVAYAMRQDEKVILYADGLGRFEGVIARIAGGDLTIRFTSSPAKRERTAEQLTLFINRNVVDDSTLRRHERIAVTGIISVVRCDGQRASCEATDLSISGVQLKTDIQPAVGEFLLVGPLAARVARQREGSLGLEFIGITFPSVDAAKARLGLH